MKLYMHHGRLDPDGDPCDMEGVPTGDWGFNREPLDGVVGFHVTYGSMRVFFDSIESYTIAKGATSWADGHGDYDLEVPEKFGCIAAFSAVRNRQEYFGDWGLK